MNARPTLNRSERSVTGQALVEFALIIPVALILLLAVFDVGRAVFVYNGLANAAREGARLAIVNQDKALVVQRVQAHTFASELSNAGTPGDVVKFKQSLPSGDAAATDCSPLATGCIAVVTAKSDWTAITPIIGQLVGPLNFEAKAELRVEFVCPNPNIPAYSSSSSCPRQP